MDSIVFLGRQNIALRGHRDDGPLQVDSLINEGNFRELLKSRIRCEDSELKNRLENSSSRATYISKSTQNEVIRCCGEEILSVIISRIQQAKFYALMFDETTDNSHISQMTLVFRYVYQKVPREDFVQFLDVYKSVSKFNEEQNALKVEPRLTGYNLGQIVLKTLRELNLDVKYCIGITTDGCAVMTSESVGAVATIKKEASNAVYSPCMNHKVNLSVSKASSVQSVRNAIGTIKI